MNLHSHPLPKVIVETRKLSADRARLRPLASLLPPRRPVQRVEREMVRAGKSAA